MITTRIKCTCFALCHKFIYFMLAESDLQVPDKQDGKGPYKLSVQKQKSMFKEHIMWAPQIYPNNQGSQRVLPQNNKPHDNYVQRACRSTAAAAGKTGVEPTTCTHNMGQENTEVEAAFMWHPVTHVSLGHSMYHSGGSKAPRAMAPRLLCIRVKKRSVEGPLTEHNNKSHAVRNGLDIDCCCNC